MPIAIITSASQAMILRVFPFSIISECIDKSGQILTLLRHVAVAIATGPRGINFNFCFKQKK